MNCRTVTAKYPPADHHPLEPRLQPPVREDQQQVDQEPVAERREEVADDEERRIVSESV